jgi:hypothetical protein
MSLDRTKLQKVRDLANGGLQAQCPACAETGQDRTGEHLRISPEGKFGCCVYPGDRKHRSRIFALAGEHGPKAIRVRVASAKTAETLQLDLLGRLGRVFATPTEGQVTDTVNLGTLGTPTYSLKEDKKEISISKLVDNRTSVPNVPTIEPWQQSDTGVPSVPALPGRGSVRLPYLTPSGDLRIPFDSPERYHWWKPPHEKRLRVKEILAEIRERKENGASPF